MRNVLLLLAGAWVISKLMEDDLQFKRVEIPGSFERDPDQACPATHFEVFVDGKNWCVPKGA